MNRPLALVFCFVSIFLFGSCVTTQDRKDRAKYDRDIQTLEMLVEKKPHSAILLRDLGIQYYEIANYKKAIGYLARSFDEDSSDAKTISYLGSAYELNGDDAAALTVYSRYATLPPSVPERNIAEARALRLHRELIHRQISVALANAERLPDSNLDPHSLAVFPLSQTGSDNMASSLGRGLSQILIEDLNRLNTIQVVEPLRIQYLLDALSSDNIQTIDPLVARRIGKILHAGYIFGGSYNVYENRLLTVNVAVWDLPHDDFPPPTTRSDILQNLFKIEKALINTIVIEMGLTITPDEQKELDRIPTTNPEAFLAFSRGLQQEDLDNFEGAAQSFRHATGIDPGFTLAGDHARTASLLSQYGGSTKNILTAVITANAQPPGAAENLLNNRIDALGHNIGINFGAGREARVNSEGTTGAGVALPEPPPPPRPPR